jgi:hypothetical protein
MVLSVTVNYFNYLGAVFPVLGAFDEGGHLMSMGTSRSETFSILMFAAALTSCFLHASEHH